MIDMYDKHEMTTTYGIWIP